MRWGSWWPLRRWQRAPRLASVDEAYARWAELYPPRPHNPLMQIEQDTVTSLLRATRARRALDVGTGTGRNVAVLRAAGAEHVVGLDRSLAMLTCGVACSRVCADACRVPFRAAAFDLITSSLMAGDIASLECWLREMARVLAPGGHLIYSDFHPTWCAAGWRRTFRAADGAHLELGFHPHGLSAHRDALATAGLQTLAILEPFHPTRNVPVLTVVHAMKTGRQWGDQAGGAT
ncbi:MAG: class I SAM-dependent methyltransferase [Vicinamibacterales bacterium]